MLTTDTWCFKAIVLAKKQGRNNRLFVDATYSSEGMRQLAQTIIHQRDYYQLDRYKGWRELLRHPLEGTFSSSGAPSSWRLHMATL
jgi:hypothetical protein